MRKKPWRRIRKIRKGTWGTSNFMIRRICYGMLILELAVLVQQNESHIVEVRQWTEKVEAEQAEDAYGLRIRLKDGAVELYQKQYQGK